MLKVFIRSHLEGQIARATQAVIRTTHQTKTIHVDYFSIRGSLGPSLSISNTTSALEMRPDGYSPNIKVYPFDETELSHFEHFSI